MAGCEEAEGPAVSDLGRDERLALAVRAEVAEIRAEEAHERHAALQERAAPLYRAIEELERRYGEDVDPAGHFDELKALIAHHGGADIDLPQGMPLMIGMHQALADHETAAADAIQELHAAMGQGQTVCQWVGCSADEYHEAVEAALKV